jgi:TolB-like protein/Flp pilus assembly protein TadD
MDLFRRLIEWTNANEGLLQALAMLGGVAALLLSLARQRSAESPSPRADLRIDGLPEGRHGAISALISSYRGSPELRAGVIHGLFTSATEAVGAALAASEALTSEETETVTLSIAEQGVERGPSELLEPGRVAVSAEIRRSLGDGPTLSILASGAGGSFPFLVEGSLSPSATRAAAGRRFLLPLAGAALLTAGLWLWLAPGSESNPGSVPSAALRAGEVDLPTIAVLPFTSMSQTEEHELLSDGLTEDIITLLARSSGLEVIARNSTFQFKGRSVDVRSVGRELRAEYVVEGSLRPIGDRVRVTVQLIDASSGTHVWAEKYDRPLAELFAIQDDVTTGIAAGVGDEVFKVQSIRAAQAQPQNLDTWSLTWRADANWSLEDAREAIRLDPGYGRAHAVYARNLALQTMETNLDPRLFAEAVQSARRGAELAPDDVIVRTHLGVTLLWSGDPRQALSVLERVPSLSPSYAEGIAWYGDALIHNGRPVEGLAFVDRAVELTPNARMLWVYEVIRAEALIHQGHFEDARTALERALLPEPHGRFVEVYLAGVEAVRGNTDRARTLMEEARRKNPTATTTGYRASYNSYSVDDGGPNFDKMWNALEAEVP